MKIVNNILNYIFCLHIMHIFNKIALGLMSVIWSQQWFKSWLGAIRQQAIIIADQYICHHTSLGDNVLTNYHIISIAWPL